MTVSNSASGTGRGLQATPRLNRAPDNTPPPESKKNKLRARMAKLAARFGKKPNPTDSGSARPAAVSARQQVRSIEQQRETQRQKNPPTQLADSKRKSDGAVAPHATENRERTETRQNAQVFNPFIVRGVYPIDETDEARDDTIVSGPDHHEAGEPELKGSVTYSVFGEATRAVQLDVASRTAIFGDSQSAPDTKDFLPVWAPSPIVKEDSDAWDRFALERQTSHLEREQQEANTIDSNSTSTDGTWATPPEGYWDLASDDGSHLDQNPSADANSTSTDGTSASSSSSDRGYNLVLDGHISPTSELTVDVDDSGEPSARARANANYRERIETVSALFARLSASASSRKAEGSEK